MIDDFSSDSGANAE